MDVKKLLTPRPVDMHKGNRGRLLIAGGSLRYPGAPALSSLGALRSGAGVVTLLSLVSVCKSCAARLPEVIYCAEDDMFRWKEVALSQKNIDAIVIGPGLDRTIAAEIFVSRMWNEWPGKILVDGDGLNALAVTKDDLKPRKDAVLTPHEGEAGRLLGLPPAAVKSDRAGAVRELAERWGCVVLKGHHTLVSDGERLEEVAHGGPELSVPGSGDVLSGCIGAFLAMGLEAFDAAVLGTTVHGMAGEFVAKTGVDGVLASEIAHSLRRVLNDLRTGNAKA